MRAFPYLRPRLNSWGHSGRHLRGWRSLLLQARDVCKTSELSESNLTAYGSLYKILQGKDRQQFTLLLGNSKTYGDQAKAGALLVYRVST